MKIKLEAKINFFNELKSFYNSGFNLTECLDLFQAQLIPEIKISLKKGELLSRILQKYLEPEIIYLIQSAEKSGDLSSVLDMIVRYYETKKQTFDRIFQIALYPLITIIFSLLIIVFFVLLILPKYKSLYVGLGVTGEIFVINKYVLSCLAVFVFFGFLFRRKIINFFKRNKLVRAAEQIYLIYLIAILWQNADLSAFFWQLAANHPAAPKLYNLAFCLKKGSGLAEALKMSDLIDNFVYQRIAQGEKTAKLKQSLWHLAAELEKQLSRKIEAVLFCLEPALILLVGLIIGGLALQMILPVVHLTQNLL